MYPANSTQTSTGSNPFQTLLAGQHYLASSSAFRDVGTASGMSSTLTNEIRVRTTDPPQILAGPITTTTTLSPLAVRDTNTFDLGYPSAIAVVWFVVVVGFVVLFNVLFRRRERLEY